MLRRDRTQLGRLFGNGRNDFRVLIYNKAHLAKAGISAPPKTPDELIADDSGTGAALHSHTLSFDHNGSPLPSIATSSFRLPTSIPAQRSITAGI